MTVGPMHTTSASVKPAHAGVATSLRWEGKLIAGVAVLLFMAVATYAAHTRSAGPRTMHISFTPAWLTVGILMSGFAAALAGLAHFYVLYRRSEARAVALERHWRFDRQLTVHCCVSSIAHRLGSPLNVIDLRAQMIASRALTQEQAQHNAGIVVEQVVRITKTLREMVAASSARATARAPIDLTHVIREAISLIEHTCRARKIAIVLTSPMTELRVDGDAQKLVHLIVNVLNNACEATPDGGVLRIEALHEAVSADQGSDEPAQRYVCIRIEDQGRGIASDLLPKVFDPFVSSKCTEESTGLGLTVAQAIACAHDGFISIDSREGQGSRAKIYLAERHDDAGISNGWPTLIRR